MLNALIRLFAKRPEAAHAERGKLDAWMREAFSYHRDGDAVQAEALYRRILEADPEYADALYLLGEIERERQRWNEAIALLERAVRRDANSARFRFSLGCALQAMGRLEPARDNYRRAAELDGADAETWNNLGGVEQALGRPIEAEGCYRRALKLDPGLAQAHFNLGQALQATGRLDAAADSLRRVVELQPGHGAAWMRLGVVVHQLGRHQEAIECYRKVLEIEPHQHEAGYNAGCAFQALGRIPEAIECYLRALEINPDYAEAEMNLGYVLQQRGRMEEAITRYRRALELKPDYVEAYLNLGQALAETGQAGAAACFERAIEVNPQFAKAYNNLGVLQDRQGHLRQAMETLRRAIAVAPDFAESYCSLGYLCMKDGKLDEAEACFSRAAQLDPGLAQAHNNLGFMLQKRKAFDEAEQAYLRAIECHPGMGEALHNLGNLYLEQCRLPEAEQILRKAFAVDPRHANLLFLFNYLPGREPAEDFAEYRRWHARLVAPTAPAATCHGNDPDPRRRLRIGYVSPDFCRHSVVHFFEPLLAARDRGRYEIFCYSNTPASKWDEVTEGLRAAADNWREIRDLGDDEASDLIRRDRIDILVDLAGHTDGHRLLLFARRPAPVQVTYIGYPNTTGLEAMDYRITDPWADPPGSAGDSCYTEKLLRLPRGFLCYGPDRDAPDPAPLPALATGHVTFASFNNLAKVNRELIALWSRILRAVPGSRLLLKAASLQDLGTRERITGWFAEHGVDAARLELRAPEKGVREHLEWYHRADIALDTFPYNGTTTTCEALWMGVPVITLAGERHAGRVGVSLLKTVGLDRFIAENSDDYVAKAAALASDPQQLGALRKEMRSRIASSPLCDAPGLTREIEAAYRRMWERWCRRQGDAPAPGQDSAAPGVDRLIREGYRLLEAGQLAPARVVLEGAAREHPQHPDVCCLLGEVELRSGRPAAAVALLRAAVAADGESAHFHYRLGCALQGAGMAQEAAGSFHATLRIAPDHIEALNNLGCIEEALGRDDSAVECYRRALSLMPTLPQAHYNLAGALAKHGALEAAVGHYRSAVEFAPGHAEAHNNLGNVLRQLDRLDEAVAELRRAVALRPQFAEAWNNLGNVLQLKGLLGEAEGCYRQALEITPDYADALANLASAHQAQGRIEDALQSYEKALVLGPDHSAAASNRLFVMHYLSGVTGRELLEQSRRWGSHSGTVPARPTFENARDPEQRLVIGYVSPDFRRHSVAYFFEPLLEAHDRGRFEIICYSNAPRQDEVSARLRALADRWREIRGLSDEDACEAIRADRVDILVDLAGHTAGNRLGIFARRPAPVAVTYLGYPGTTGLEAIGYRLTDADADPPGTGDADYVEALVRLPAGFLCYRPEADAPEAAEAPCTRRGVVTFGSFNNMAKVNAPLIEAWSEILRRVPGARLLLKNTSLHDDETRERVMKQFASHGIDAGRLELRGAETAMKDHLEWYHSIDVALDTYPYNGTTTTCEALWMGVPVIALAGDRHAGRVGASLLRRLGLDDLVADSVDVYVDRAVRLAADRGRLQSLRREMRARVAASPLCDPGVITRGIEDAYRNMWRRWCGGGA